MKDLDLSSLREQYKVREHFYRVTQFVTTFGEDPGNNDSYRHAEDFKDKNLLKAREKAILYFNEKSDGLKGGSYFLPFEGPETFVSGKNAAFSITFSFVMLLANGEEDEIFLCDHEGEEAQQESLEYERLILEEQGYTL